ncbi:hypothetical protein HY440_03175, partial [Candidatus Microgenomates bacterium]|nr:hypothetical protein [Candidatus Microgenomates bacterium]
MALETGGVAEEFETRDTGGLISVSTVCTELAARSLDPASELRMTLPAVGGGGVVTPRTTNILEVDAGQPRAAGLPVIWTGERIFSHEAMGNTKGDITKWLLIIFGSVHGTNIDHKDQEKKVLSTGVADRAIEQMKIRRQAMVALGGPQIPDADWTELENMTRGLYWIHNANAFFVLSEGNAKFYIEKMFAGKEAPPFKDEYIQAIFKNCPGTEDGYNFVNANLAGWQASARLDRDPRVGGTITNGNFEVRKQHRAVPLAPRLGGWLGGNTIMENYQWDLGLKFAEIFGDVARANRWGPGGIAGWWKDGGDDPIQAVLYPWRFPAGVKGSIGDAILEQMLILSRRFDTWTYLQRETVGESFTVRARAGATPTQTNLDTGVVEPISFPAWFKTIKRAFDAWDLSMKALSNPGEIEKAGPAIANHSRTGATPMDLLDTHVRSPGPYSIARKNGILAQLTAFSFSNFRQLTNQESLKEFIKKQGGIRKFYEKFTKGPDMGNYPRTWNETRVQVGRWQGDLYSAMEAIVHGQNFGEAFRELLKSGGELAKYVAEAGV